MRLDDFINFGRTVPEASKRYGEKVCMAGYSQELRQLVRIYPLPPGFSLQCRTVSMIELERNRMDSRIESWAIRDRDPDRRIRVVEKKINQTELVNILEKEKVGSIDTLNDARRSLGVLKVNDVKPVVRARKQVENPVQLSLFNDLRRAGRFKVSSEYFLAPYLQFFDVKSHTLQIRDWGLYELMRKYESCGRLLSAVDIVDSLRIEPGRDVFLVVGNLASCRTAWIIIKVFSFKNRRQMALF